MARIELPFKESVPTNSNDQDTRPHQPQLPNLDRKSTVTGHPVAPNRRRAKSPRSDRTRAEARGATRKPSMIRSTGATKRPTRASTPPTTDHSERGPGLLSIRRDLLTWYAHCGRTLPWRQTRDPYQIWVSEVMLQQTRVATVIDYYERWRKRFPTVQALAAADEAEVLRYWEGLGYYSRAKNLRRAAQQIVSELSGKMPETAEGLRRLPGVGAYTAGAVASIAFDARAPAIDGNVIRVLSRLFGIRGNPQQASTRANLQRAAQSLLPEGAGSGDLNQALMELGASHCSPRNPQCLPCPVRPQCVAFREGTAELLPELPKRPRATREQRVVLIATRRGRILLQRAPEGAVRWAGLWQFPSASTPDEANADSEALALTGQLGLNAESLARLPSAVHQITRFHITLHVREVAAGGGRIRPTPGWAAKWLSPAQTRQLAMPAPHRRIQQFLEARPPIAKQEATRTSRPSRTPRGRA